MAKIEKPSSEELLRELIKIHVPQEYLAYFDLVEVKDKPDCYELVLHEKVFTLYYLVACWSYELVLHEKEDQVPEVLKGKEVVLDGFSRLWRFLSIKQWLSI